MAEIGGMAEVVKKIAKPVPKPGAIGKAPPLVKESVLPTIKPLESESRIIQRNEAGIADQIKRNETQWAQETAEQAEHDRRERQLEAVRRELLEAGKL